ncbi:MAG: BMC domain-containing protein [Ignavibacteriales bacterium]|nr:MAG: BMC domain-containing protein [Ignavibacteriales bacterium]
MPKAFGLVETRGLVAAIEAADAMVKTSNIKLIGKERTDPAMITIKIVGDVAAVKSAVEAGAEAARKVGEIVATHIIPQPDQQLTNLFPELDDEKLIKKTPVETVEEKPKKVVVEKSKQPEDVQVVETKTSDESAKDTIARLRKEALGEKQSSKSESDSSEMMSLDNVSLDEVESMNVHQLRHFARSVAGFPIQGREISRANRPELIKHFRQLKK